MKLFVANLSYETTDEGLRVFFEECGSVVSAHVITDRESGRSRGFGFVEMGSAEEMHAAIDRLHDSSLDGRKLVVKEAENRPSRR